MSKNQKITKHISELEPLNQSPKPANNGGGNGGKNNNNSNNNPIKPQETQKGVGPKK